jgi:hypothetical protein
MLLGANGYYPATAYGPLPQLAARLLRIPIAHGEGTPYATSL